MNKYSEIYARKVSKQLKKLGAKMNCENKEATKLQKPTPREKIELLPRIFNFVWISNASRSLGETKNNQFSRLFFTFSMAYTVIIFRILNGFFDLEQNLLELLREVLRKLGRSVGTSRFAVLLS